MRIRNVWIENVYFEHEDERNEKRNRYVQVPAKYNAPMKLLVDGQGSPVLNPQTGKPMEAPDTVMTPCNTYLAIRHIANVAVNVTPIDKQTGRPVWNKEDSKQSARVLKQLKSKLLNPLGAEGGVVALEEATYKWVKGLLDERGMDIFSSHFDAVSEAIDATVKDDEVIEKIPPA